MIIDIITVINRVGAENFQPLRSHTRHTRINQYNIWGGFNVKLMGNTPSKLSEVPDHTEDRVDGHGFAFGRDITCSSDYVYEYGNVKDYGFSVRCVSDN